MPIEQFVSTSPSFSTTPPRIGRVSAESVSFAAFPAFWSSAFACSTTACPTRSRSSAQKISSSLPDALARAASCAQSFVYSAVGSERSCCSCRREGGVDERRFVSSSCRRAAIPGRALIAFELLIGLGLCFRRQPLLLKLDPAVIVRAELRCLFPGLRADRGGLGLGIGKNARGNFFNSVHCFTLVCGVTC